MNRDCKAEKLAGSLFFQKFVAKIPLLPEGDNKIFIRLKYFLQEVYLYGRRLILPLKGGLPMTLYDFLTLVFLVTICIVALKA